MKLLLDEMYPPRLAEELRARGHDVVTIADRPELKGKDDEPLLFAATAEGRVLVSENVSDFPDIIAVLTTEGRPVCGVVLVASRTFPRTDRALGQLIRALDAYLKDRVATERVPGGLHWLSVAG